MGGFLAAASLLAACSDDEPSERTRAEFCEDWADAACTDETITACQAASQDTCRLAQQGFCQTLVPASFSDERGDDCISAVGDAYDDADLTGAEIDTVRQLGGECRGIVKGARAVGQTCTTSSDCDGSQGVECVRRGGVAGGTCQVAREVGAGQTCVEPAQTCAGDFFCNGSNCIATKPPGQPCQNDVECAANGLCGPSDTCVARLAVGSNCASDDECQSLLCYAVGAERKCAELVRLSPAEAFCGDLR
jgi:hypothetical protein